MTGSSSASPGARPASSSAHAIGVVAGFHCPLSASVVSASSFPLGCVVTTSGHGWFSPPPCLTAICLQALPAFLTVFHLFHLPVLNIFPPCPSHVSPRLPSHHPQSHSPVRLLQRHFSLFYLCKLTSLLQEASSRPSVVCPGLSSCSLCPP